MRLPGTRGQIGTRDLTFRADGSLESGSVPQLVLPEQWQRSYFQFWNNSTASMWLEFGSARATCSLSSGTVASATVSNGGFGFTRPPQVQFLGGGAGQNSSRIGTKDPYGPAPQHPAQAHCVLTADVVTSIVIDDPGSGYLVAPYVRITNDPLDFTGCADPSVGGGSGLLLYPGTGVEDNNLTVPTDQVAVFCATVSSAFFCRYL